METLFASPGWRLIKDDIDGWMKAISTQWESLSPDNLRYEQGRYQGLKQIAKHLETLETLKGQFLADEADSMGAP